MSRQVRLCMLSGKGGSGKTVLSLAIAKIMAEAGLKTAVVDCDIATHGGTYFFEREVERRSDVLSLADLAADEFSAKKLLATRAGFSFVPSTLRPADAATTDRLGTAAVAERAAQRLNKLVENYDVVVYDCQAGYSPLSVAVADRSDRRVIVLEPDAVSAAALRVLFLQMGRSLPAGSTWQLFNKLTDEERPVFEKVSGSTFFPSLPPVPFDWNVRAAFAISEIPAVSERTSAFGIAVLRLLLHVMPEFHDQLKALEQSTLGDWFGDLSDRLRYLEERRRELKYSAVESARMRRLQRARVTATVVTVSGAALGAVVVSGMTGWFPVSLEWISTIATTLMTAIIAIVAGFLYYRNTASEMRLEFEQDRAQEAISEVEEEMRRYRTLITTEPALREYARQRDFSATDRAETAG